MEARKGDLAKTGIYVTTESPTLWERRLLCGEYTRFICHKRLIKGQRGRVRIHEINWESIQIQGALRTRIACRPDNGPGFYGIQVTRAVRLTMCRRSRVSCLFITHDPEPKLEMWQKSGRRKKKPDGKVSLNFPQKN